MQFAGNNNNMSKVINLNRRIEKFKEVPL